MPVMAIYRRDDISNELYSQYRSSAPLDTVPHGALSHAYGRVGDGFVTVDVWEDAAAMDRYIRQVVIPATEALGVVFEWPEVIEVETFVATPAAKDYTVPFAEEYA